MYIKQVIIEGFTSYKDQLIADPFNPKINVIVGPNGSGKSNFFKAIRFVLNDAFAGVGPEERKKLLHEGTGAAAVSAYVEVVFDNSDGRFPIDKDEVRLRRTIGANKDEFSIDRKHVTKSEVMNLLESAGFSRANPYYVVQQGKIQEMAHMNPAQRLELLKEVGGTKVYEERRNESMKVLKETESRRLLIDDTVKSIEEKLAELNAERAELEAYQALDKQQRGIEFALLDRDLTSARKELAKVDESRAKLRAETAAAQETTQEAATQLAEQEAALAAAKQQQETYGKQLKALAKERKAALQAKAKAEADVAEAAAALESAESATSTAQQEMMRLQQQVTEVQQQLEAAQEAASEKKAAERDVEARLDDTRAQLQVLKAKQGSSQQYSSQAERDTHLKKHIQKLKQAVAGQEDTLQALRNQEEELGAALNDLASEAGDKQQLIKSLTEQIAEAEEAFSKAKEARNKAQDERKKAWQHESELKDAVSKATTEFDRAFSAWQSAVPRDVLEGLLASEELRHTHNLQGVAGCLVDLMDVPKQLVPAVDVVAGNQLFQVVVDNDGTGLQLVKLLNKAGRGRVTFMPLNRLHVPDVAYPTQFGQDAVPLYKLLKCPDKYKKAVQQVFGSFVVCRDRSIMDAVAASGAPVDGITLDGDVLRRKGTISGGFINASRSKLNTHKTYKELEGKLKSLKEQRDTAQRESDQLGENILGLEAAVSAADERRRKLRKQLADAKGGVSATEQDRKQLEEQLQHVSNSIESATATLQDLQRQIRATEAELATDMHAGLTAAERRQLAELQPRIEALEKELAKAKKEARQAASEVTKIETRLNSNLLKRMEELEASANAPDLAADRSGLEALQQDLSRAAEELSDVEGRLHALEASNDQLAKQTRELTTRCQRLREEAAAGSAAAAEEGRQAAALDTRQAQLLARCEDLARRIRELGSLSAEVFEKYQGKGTKELHSALKKVQGELSKYSHVNKKALDQFVNFTEQREQLNRRQQDVEESGEKIKQLIDSLDARKNESIERTFKGVSKNFREVFAELVPGGKGELVMQKPKQGGPPADEDGADEGDEEGQRRKDDVAEKYTGVDVKVAFSRGQQTIALRSLSGGQKTLVALALITAIQRCDPAPFYLFDEIDAALDPQYRTTVAKMLRAQADDERHPAMFIITTFHPQIVQVADKVYGVSHQNKVSYVDPITKAHALDFLQSEEAAEQRRLEQQQQQQQQQRRGRAVAAS